MNQVLYIITGLPFAGKTTLTKELVKRFGFVVASVDEMLDRGNFVVEKMTYDDWGIVYSQAFDNLKSCLKDGKTVIFDGGSLKRSERETLKKIARSFGIISKLIYVNTTREEIFQRRLKIKKTKERDPLEDVTMNKALDMFEEPTSDENPILYNQKMDLDNWIKGNIN